MVDCGHGGADPGATGLLGIKEKNINLSIGKKLATLLKKNGFFVLMTRVSDKSISLEQRIRALSQKKDPDLLISIHANSAASDKASGIETFCLKPSLFKIAEVIKDSRCRCILNKCREIQYKKSERLANLIQATTVATAKKINPCVVNRGTKHAVTRMLLGVSFPGALVEVGFLTNEQESRLLASQEYQSVLAHGLFRAINYYFENS